MKPRLLCVLFCACLLLSCICGCSHSSENTSDPTDAAPSISSETEIEIQTAIRLGLVPEDLQRDYSKTVRYSEFCTMMTSVIQKRYGEGQYMDAWLEISALAAKCSDEMTRGGGAEVLYAAAQSADIEDYRSASFVKVDLNGETMGMGMDPMPFREDLFPMYHDITYNKNWDQYDPWHHVAAQYPWHPTSPVSHKTLMDFDMETLDMRYDEAFTRAEAICAALRCFEAWSAREYISVGDPLAAAYDASIITPELLSKETTLPEVRHDQLPADWQGLILFSKGSTDYAMLDSFREIDVRFLKENGMNFARIPLSFTSLRYPDYPEDGTQVNLAELRELDQLIAWGMKYDVHISIGMLSPPGFAEGADIPHMLVGDENWPDPARWELIHDYWVMLAQRYAGISSDNLTFELCTEWHSYEEDHIEEFTQNWKQIVADIRAVSPERVLMAGFDLAGDSPLPQIMAAEGVSLGMHPYCPGALWYTTYQERIDYGYTQDLQWPMVWFPTTEFNLNNTPITISGDLEGVRLTFYVYPDRIYPTETGEPTMTVMGDGGVLGQHTYTIGAAEEGFTVEVPANVKEVTLTHTGHIRLFSIQAEGSFGTSQIMTNDRWDSYAPGAASLILNDEGIWKDIEGREFDAEAYYNIALAPYQEMAASYGVGIMVNEFFFCSDQDRKDPIPLDGAMRHYGDAIDVFEAHGIGYALTAHNLQMLGVMGDSRNKYSMWSEYPDYITWQTYTYDSGFSETFPVNTTLLNLIKEHMKN